MTCRELVGFLIDYLEDDLVPQRRAAFERHLERCPSCVAYLETYRRSVALARAAWKSPEAAADGLPPELERAIVAALRESR